MAIHWKTFVAGLAISGSFVLTGCTATTASTRDVDLDGEDIHYKSTYDYADLRNVTEAVAAQLIDSAFIQNRAEPPVMIVTGYQNRTTGYVDTKNLTDRVRTLALQSGKIRFVNESRRADILEEQEYQAAYVSPGVSAAIGRQLGAQYMFSGSLTEIKQETGRQVRLSKKQLNYYKLTSEVTDLESGELLWTAEEEFAREASKPLIGW